MSRYLPARPPNPDPQQRWKTFLRNHREVVAGMDFFVVPTVRFRLLYVWFALDHGRRRVLHFNVTEHPTASWVIQQLREALPDEASHRFLLYDNDAIFSAAVTKAIANLGVSAERTAFRSPWQNGTAERFVGAVRREPLDHVVVLDEDHLRRLLREYVDFHERDRVHTVLKDSPLGRPIERRPSPRARVVGSPLLASAGSTTAMLGAKRPDQERRDPAVRRTRTNIENRQAASGAGVCPGVLRGGAETTRVF